MKALTKLFWIDPGNRAIHRGDYQKVLLDEALAAGAHAVTSAEVTGICSAADGPQTVLLKDGRRISADVVIGADGMANFFIQILSTAGASTLRRRKSYEQGSGL